MMDSFIDEFNPPQNDVTVCGSMSHKNDWLKVIEQLRAAGLRVATPDLSETTDWSALTEDEIVYQKGRLIRRHFANIAVSRAVLVCNYDKNDTNNYIGSNSFLEMGAAFVYDKRLFVLNEIPNQSNREEILAMQPKVLYGDIQKLLDEVAAS